MYHTENFHWQEDILKEDLHVDTITDMYCFYDWLFCDDDSDWEVVDVDEVQIWSWKEFRTFMRWRNIHSEFGFGDLLPI